MSEKLPIGWQQSGLAWWPLGLVTFVLDQITKETVHRLMQLHDSVYLLPVLDIVRAHNYGAAFSILAGASGWQRWVLMLFALAVSVGLLIALRRSSGALRMQNAGLMLIVSGALGNAIDRVRHGYVVDFVHAHWGAASFPAFNVADSCITVGAGLILLDALFDLRRARRTGGQGK